MKSYYCYVTNVLLDKSNHSDEHVIPNSLGGKLKSKKLLSKEVNNKFGETIDAELAKAIKFHSLLNLKRQDGQNAKISGANSKGVKYNIIDKKTGIQAPRAPRTIKVNNKIVIEILSYQKDQYINSFLKKNPNASIETLNVREKTVSNNKGVTVYPYSGFDPIPNYNCFRAIVKIILNYYLLNSGSAAQVKKAIKFVMGENDERKIVQYYFTEDKVFNVNISNTYHLIYLRGDQNQKVVYGYLELYNVHCFIVVLSTDYYGDDFEKIYCLDVIDFKEVNATGSLFLYRSQILSLPCPGPKDLSQQYKKRMRKFARKHEVSIRFKKRV